MAEKKQKPTMKDATKAWIKKQIESAVPPAVKGSERDKERERKLREMGARRNSTSARRSA